MKNAKKITLFVGLAVMAFAALSANEAKAQFSKAVVVMKGVVRNAETKLPHSVNVSVREVGNPALEITGSRSNSETGTYLVVLKPNTKYWIHLEGQDIETKDIQIVTPATVNGKTVNLVEDLLVSVLPTQNTAKK